MSLVDNFCNSSDMRKEEQKLCFEFSSYLYNILSDMEKKGYLRSELKSEQGEERKNFMNALWNVRKVTDAFNQFFDMYVDKIKSDSKQRLKKFFDLNKPYGLTEENLRYLLYSKMVFVFLQNIEEFRSSFLFAMELPVHYAVNNKNKTINKKTTLGTLLRSFCDFGIDNVEKLNVIDFDLRNGLSHGLWWIEEKGDQHHSKPHLHYSKDITFKKVKWVSISDLYLKMRKQSIYTNCLLNVIGDWFL